MIKTSLRSAGPAAAELNRQHSKKKRRRDELRLCTDGQLMGLGDGFPRQSAPGSFHEMKFHPASCQKC